MKVDDRERWGSDHRPLQIEVPISGSEPEMRCKRKIEAWSEEEDNYVTQICGDLGRMIENVSHSFLNSYHHLPLWDIGVDVLFSRNTYCF